jgi:hypothetical protein
MNLAAVMVGQDQALNLTSLAAAMAGQDQALNLMSLAAVMVGQGNFISHYMPLTQMDYLVIMI